MRNPHHSGPALDRRSGFTLVELLVVVAIIGLLVAMLMPALRKAREAAQAAQCLSNMKQLGSAFWMYANDNQGYCAPAAQDWPTAGNPLGFWAGGSSYASTTTGVSYSCVFWPQSVGRYLMPAKSIANATAAFAKTLSVWNCPTSPNPFGVGGSQFGTYGLNRGIGGAYLYFDGRNWNTVVGAGPPNVGAGETRTKRLSGIRQPGAKFLIFDCGGYVLDQTGAKNPQNSTTYWFIPGYNPTRKVQYNGDFTNDSVWGRHGMQRMNVVFADSHGETWGSKEFVGKTTPSQAADFGWTIP